MLASTSAWIRPRNLWASAGYPMGNFGPVSRLPVEETVHWDQW